MTFQPALPLPGYAGWRLLTRTAEAQQDRLAASPTMRRDTAAFRDRIGQIASAEALVADRQVLRVALGAFGLDADLPAKAFVRKVLDSAEGDPRSLANRLADPRYRAFARTFGFAAAGGPLPRAPDFAGRIVAAYETRQFEIAVGVQDETFRLALNARRELADIAGRGLSETGAWFTVMAQPPLRQVFETAFGLPGTFGQIDIDRQRQILSDRAERLLGDGRVAQFARPARTEELVKLYLLRAQSAQGQTAPASAALMLLQAVPRPAVFRG